MSKVTAQDVLNVMRSWLGYNESDGSFQKILDIYNSHKPLARGYKIKPSDQWCDCTVSAAAIRANAVDIIGTEVGCEHHVQIFKEKDIWIEDGTIVPEPGYIILYNWDDRAQPNDGGSDHIGYVETVTPNYIICIEGNKNGRVERRKIPIGWGCIRGFAAPKYANPIQTIIVEDKEELNMTKEELMSVSGTGDKPSPWAQEATQEMKDLGIFNGDGNGNYGWQQPLSREAMAVVLSNFKKALGLK